MKKFFVVAIVLLALFAPLFTAPTLHAQVEQSSATEQTQHPYANLRDKTLINTENSSDVMAIFTTLMVVLLVGSIFYVNRRSKSGSGYAKS